MGRGGTESGWMASALTTTAALHDLKAVVEEAKNVNLDDVPAPYSDNVKHALGKVKHITPDSTVEKINEARLALRVALDAMTVDLDRATIADLQTMVKAGKLTYEKLVHMYLARIDLYDKHTVKLNAVSVINPHAIASARHCDAAVRADASQAEGMFGIPVLIKDNIGTAAADGMPTTAGSIALANHYPERDAFVVTQLKKAGAIILGKTNLSEFANFITYGMWNGYSTLKGQVLNPYLPGVLNVGGSSSGSGAAGAAALAAITVGTETSGSILSPATKNSLVGLKPTVGLISRNGIIPLAHSQDTAGPMGRNVSDVAVLLTVMQGYDPGDQYVNMGVDNEIVVDEAYLKEHMKDYTAYLSKDGLKGKALGVYKSPDKENAPDLYAAFQKVLRVLEEQGAKIVYAADGGDMEDELPAAPDTKVLFYDFKQDIEKYIHSQTKPILASDHQTVIKSLQDVIDYNARHLDVLKYGQTILQECAGYDMTPGSKDTLTAQEHRAADIRFSRKNGINYLLTKYSLDALIGFKEVTTMIAAMAGYPSITVPVGYHTADGSNGLPIHLQITGDAFTEADLIGMGYALEQAAQARIAPGMAVKDRLKALIDDAEATDASGKEVDAALAAYHSNFASQREVDEAADAIQKGTHSPNPFF